MQHPGLFNTQLAGIAGVFLISRPMSELTGPMNVARLYYITEAAKHVRTELANTKVPPSDEVLMAVSNLIGYSADVDNSEFPESHPISPLAKVHNLDKFGRLTYIKTHRDALSRLMTRKGGLRNIRMPGLKDLLMLIDIQYATIEGTTPFLDRPSERHSMLGSGAFIPDAEALHMLSYLGRSFEQSGLDDEVLLEASKTAAEITAAFDQHERMGGSFTLLSPIVRARDGLHHDLLTLPSTMSKSNLLVKAWLYAILIYSDMVLWPTPSGKRVKSRLARRLHTVLEDAWIRKNWNRHQAFLDWTCFMGAIAASFTENRSWYIELLRRLGHPELLKWQGLTNAMKGFLWWEPVFEMPAMQVWAELQDNS
jgi:hypothetical protein